MLRRRHGAGSLVHSLRRQNAGLWRLQHKTVCSSTEVELNHWLNVVPWKGDYPRAVFADHQIRGQGQRGRRWESPHGGVWLSAALPWDQRNGHADMLGLMVALALTERLEKEGLDVRIKWPNDLLIHSFKVAGLLPRLIFRGDRLRMVRVGIGMNVANPVPIGAISLRRLLPRGQARRDVWTVEVLQALERVSQLAEQPDFVRLAIENRLWARQVQDPKSGEIWDIKGLGTNGALQLCQGTRTTSWTRSADLKSEHL